MDHIGRPFRLRFGRLKIPNRILINPAISFNDLNNVPEYARQTTHGFFDQEHEADYERFCSVYPSAMLSLNHDVDYDRIAPIIDGIINEASQQPIP